MTRRSTGWQIVGLAASLAVLAAGCGGNDPFALTSTPTPQGTNTQAPTTTFTPTHTLPISATPTQTPTPTRTNTFGATATATMTPQVTPTTAAASVKGFLVVSRGVNASPGDGLGAPPTEWVGTGDPSSFDRALAHADYSVDGDPNTQGVSGADGHFEIAGLQPGRHELTITKTLAGNLAAFTVPFAAGDDGSAEVVIEVSWGVARSSSSYTHAGVQVRDLRGPYGTWLVTRDGRISAFGDGARTFTDPDADGRFDVSPCLTNGFPPPPAPCPLVVDCTEGETCVCPAQCPDCRNCLPDGCPLPTPAPTPYPCDAGGTCAQPGDRCTCIPSCAACDDCPTTGCVPGCPQVEISTITITSGPTELVVGQQGSVYATAQLSDGSQFDVTYLATWASSDDTVATVDSWGTVSALAVGSANLTATIGDLTSAPWPLKVADRPTLLHIYVQNVSCFYPLGVPEDYGKAAPPADSPGQTNFLPVPTCGQVVVIGGTIQFRATGEFANGYYQDITDEVQWQVAPPEIGDVTGGLFTARQAGTAQLTAALGAVVSDATEIKVVTQPTLVALSIYTDNGAIVADGVATPAAAAVPCLVLAPGKDPAAGIPSEPGVCCCPGPLATDGIAQCNCNYSVTVLPGDTLQFHATAHYDTGEWRDVTEEVTWRSNNTAAASIDAHGAMSAVDAGDATIDAVLDDTTSNAIDVHVVNSATLLSIYIYQEGGNQVVATGDQRFFKAYGNYDVGFNRDVTTDATWHSSDESVGGFDTPGVFTGRAAGTAEVWAELSDQQSARQSLEVFETSELSYCDAANINRAVWSDDFDRVTLESDCAQYTQPGVVTLRYTVTETQPHGGIFNPCLDLYVVQGTTTVRAIRKEGCGDPFLPAAALGREDAVLKYQLQAFWDLKDESGNPVPPGTYTIYGRFFLYYDPVVKLDVTVLGPGGATPRPTATPTPFVACTPPLCGPGEVFYCPGSCPGGCGTICATPPPTGVATPVVVLAAGSAAGAPGDHVRFDVTLRFAPGAVVAETENDLHFDLATAVAANADGAPDCLGNPAITKDGTKFAFQPPGCHPSTDCEGIHAVVVALHDTDSIPNGAVLYTCGVDIAATALLGIHPVTMISPIASSPLGTYLPVVGTDGQIVVTGGSDDTPTPTPADTRMPTATPTGAVLVEGACFRGADCGGGFTLTSQSKCCEIARLSLSPVPFSWCPRNALDTTGTCQVCGGDPCTGLPTATPTAAGGGPQKQCLREANMGQSCMSDADCPGSRCVAATQLCSYGTYDGAPCEVDGDCAGGCCGGCYPTDTPTPSGGLPKTPTPLP
jgi:Big-like domain-containing protein